MSRAIWPQATILPQIQLVIQILTLEQSPLSDQI